MKKVDIGNYSNKLHFPIIQAVHTKIETNFFRRIIKFTTYRRKWKICEDYCLWVPHFASWIFIPKNFIFDGASVPKILNSVYNPNGILLLGAGPHDFGYRYKGLLHADYRGYLKFVPYNKDELDNIFNHLCSYESGMSKASKIAQIVLSAIGFLGWKSNRKANHVLMDDFPELFVPEEVKDKENYFTSNKSFKH